MAILYSSSIVTAATLLPLSVEEAKAQLRITVADQDDLIEQLIKAAVRQFEYDTEMQLMDSTWKMVLDCFPPYSLSWNANILIWKNPVSEITSIQYYPEDGGALQSLDSSSYYVEITGVPARIRIDDLPDVYDKPGAVIVNYKAGFTSASAVDEGVKQVLRFLIGHYYENPSAVMTGTQVNNLPLTYLYSVQNYLKRYI